MVHDRAWGPNIKRFFISLQKIRAQPAGKDTHAVWTLILLTGVSLKDQISAKRPCCESLPPCSPVLLGSSNSNLSLYPLLFFSSRPWAEDRRHSEGWRSSHCLSSARRRPLVLYSLPAHQRKVTTRTGAVFKGRTCRLVLGRLGLTVEKPSLHAFTHFPCSMWPFFETHPTI